MRASCSHGGILPLGRIAQRATRGPLRAEPRNQDTPPPQPFVPQFGVSRSNRGPGSSLAESAPPLAVAIPGTPKDAPTAQVVRSFPQFLGDHFRCPARRHPRPLVLAQQFETFRAADPHAGRSPPSHNISAHGPAGSAEDTEYAARATGRGIARACDGFRQPDKSAGSRPGSRFTNSTARSTCSSASRTRCR